ncbi:MAG TPA: hypothetical protein PLO44_02165 [Candidatus Paceibacterota bacterium]|nr:hypothetical protein [Candidatus Paceibacterota bacterium]
MSVEEFPPIKKDKKPEEENAKVMLLHAFNQFIEFKTFIKLIRKSEETGNKSGLSYSEIKKILKNTEFKNLEEITEHVFSLEELEKIRPGIGEIYKTLVKEFKRPNLKLEELEYYISMVEDLIKDVQSYKI